MAGSFLRAWVTAWTLLIPGHSLADSFGTRDGSAPRTTRIDAVILDDARPGYVLIEQIILINEAAQLVWLRPFKHQPETSSGPDIFASLAEAAVRPPELADQLRRNPFGPSVAGLVARRLTPPDEPSTSEPPPPGRPLQVDRLEVFRGETITSTITGELELPPGLTEFLRRFDVELEAPERAEVAAYLSLGWSMLAVAFFDAAPSSELPARIGPVRFDFDDGDPGYPLLRRGPSALDRLVLYGLSPRALIPKQLPARVGVAGRDTPGPPGVVVVTHGQPLAQDPDLAFELADGAGLPVDETTVLTQAILRPGGEQIDRLVLAPPEMALDAPTLPAPSRRGSAPDIIVCLLFGLAPLVLAPESWLLGWLQRQARTAARGDASRLGVKLWSGWALLVAAFWFFALDDLARFAALGPLVVGLFALAAPYVGGASPPVRAAFKRTARKAAAEERESRADRSQRPEARSSRPRSSKGA